MLRVDPSDPSEVLVGVVRLVEVPRPETRVENPRRVDDVHRLLVHVHPLVVPVLSYRSALMDSPISRAKRASHGFDTRPTNTPLPVVPR